MKIGAQMFTVREFTQDLDSFARTLQRIADIGYTTVQVSATCPLEGAWLKEQLDKTGLQCVLTHTPMPRLTGELDKVIEDHTTFGCKYIGLGWYAFDPEKNGMSYENFIATFKPIARRMKEAGKLFMYHNHDQEFKKLDSKLVLDKLMEDFAPDEMGFILDTFWVQAGGGDPAWWLEKLAGREDPFACLKRSYDFLKSRGFN